MKAWGVDGLSRGDLLEGMMAGQDPLSFIPLSEEPIKGPKEVWTGGSGAGRRMLRERNLGRLTFLDRSNQGQPIQPSKHGGSESLDAPPAAMEMIMNVFNEDRMAHPKRAHVLVVPRLMTHLWRKQLGKDAEVLMTITA